MAEVEAEAAVSCMLAVSGLILDIWGIVLISMFSVFVLI